MEEAEVSIKLLRINGKTLTFNPDVYFKLRSEHRIVGKLIGIPVVNPRNVGLNGMPAIYNEYETKLLVDRGLVSLIEKKGLRKPPSENIKESYQEHQRSIVAEFQKPYIEKKLELTRKNMHKIIAGRVKKSKKDGNSGAEIHINPDDILMEEEKKLQQTMTIKNSFSQVPTQHPFEVHSESIKKVLIKNLKKYKVFEDLWGKGFFITTGNSFGGDFLVYPGDPNFFHASQIIHVIDKCEELDIKFLISCARLSVSVKKKCMFAYVNEDDSVTYQEFAWDNPKLNQLYSMLPENNDAS